MVAFNIFMMLVIKKAHVVASCMHNTQVANRESHEFCRIRDMYTDTVSGSTGFWLS
jgi:hypothetical protein